MELALVYTTAYAVTLILLFCPPVTSLDLLGIPEADILDVYNQYREAAGDGSRRSASRQVFKNNTEYQIHVKRLKGVNGFKAHNLIIRSGGQPNVNKTMYINNPVESKMPQSFLSLDEFKQALIKGVQKRRERVKLKLDLIKAWKVKRKGRKPKPTGTAKTFHTSTIVDSNKTIENITQVNSKRTKISMKKHHSQLVPNLLTEDFNVNVTIPLKTNGNFIKEHNKTNPAAEVEVSKQSIELAKNTGSALLLVDENPILRSNKNISESTKIAAETSTFIKPQLTNHNETVSEITKSDLETPVTNAATDTDVTETAISEKVTTDEPTTEETVETEVLTTESTRATLGRPAVYMGY